MSLDTALPFRSARVQIPVVLVSLGHGATHWIASTLYILLPFIGRDLGLDYTETGALMTCFYIGSAAANLPSGTFVDLTGKRVPFQVAALTIGSLALFALGLVRAIPLLCLLTATMGAANMMWHPAAISYLSGLLPRNRGYALAMHSLGAHLGDALAPLAAGWLLLSVAWPQAAGLNALVGLASAVAIFAALARSDAGAAHAAKRLHLRRYVADMAAIMRTRAMWSLCLMSGFRTMMQSGLLLFLPLYLANELKLGPLWMGFAMMVLQLGGVVAAPIAGTLSDKVGRRPIILAGMSGTTILVLLLTFIGDARIYVFCVSVLGFAMYAMRPVIHSWLMDRSPPSLAASMTSAMFGTQAVLSALAPLIGGWLADRWGLVAVFYFLAASILVANLLALAVPKTEHGD